MRESCDSRKSRLGASAAAATDDARLEHAMQQADDLLVRSLQTEDRVRVRRKYLVFLTLGGLVMLAVVCFVLVTLLTVGTTDIAHADESAVLAQQGWQLWREQKPDEAIAKFEEAVKLAPRNTNAWNGLGWANFNSGRSKDAEIAFKKVITIEPKHPAALNGLGQIYFFQRDYDAAEKYLLRASPQASAAWYGLAKLYLLKGNFDQAEKWAKKLVDSGEADDGAKQMLQAAEAKQLPENLRSLIEPPALADSHAEFMQAWKYFNQGRNAEARELFEQLAAADPDNPNILNGLGWALLNSGMIEEAKPKFEKALNAEPDASGPLNGLARVLKAQGDIDGAIKVWQHMLEVSPGPNAGTYGLAEAYLEQENYQAALPLLEQMLNAKPENKQLQAKLKLAKEKAGS